MRAAAIWLCLGIFWSMDAFFAWRRHGARSALAAAIAAIAFLAAGVYFASRRGSRSR